MAFTKINKGDYFIQEETLTLASGAATAISSTAFEGKADKDFLVVANTGAVNTTGAIVVNVLGSYDGTNYGVIKASLIADADSAVKIANFDVQTLGQMPYYKVQLAPASDEQAKEIKIAIVRTKL